jgi:hypothetical protein
MPPYLGIQNNYLWLVFGLGLFISITIILARGIFKFNFSWERQDPERYHEDELEEFGSGDGLVREGHGPLPIFFRLVVLGWALWATGYVIYRSLG